MADEMLFKTRQDFRKWLLQNNSKAGIWLILGKDISVPTLTASEALEEALCFGWIDGLIKRIDDSTYRKYFAPRRKGSPWSEKNKRLVQKLIDEKLMTDKGLEVIRRAQKDGSWNLVQDRTIPEEKFVAFENLIRKTKRAHGNYVRMPRSTKSMFVGLYFEAKKEETRERRLKKLIELLEQNKRPM